MSSPLFDVVVFDFDGVLLESMDIKTRAFGACVADRGPEAQAQLMDYHVRNGGMSRYAKFEWFYRDVLHEELDHQELLRLDACFRRAAVAEVVAAPAVPGALEAVKILAGVMPLYVASGTPQDELRQVLAARNMDGWFKAIYGSPPEKDVVLGRIRDETGANPKRMLMVGDSVTDLRAAQAVRAAFYGRVAREDFPGWPRAADLTQLPRYVLRGELPQRHG